MNQFLKISLLFSLFVLLNSCASTPLENLKKVTVGMNKPTVLDVAGDPDKTFRQNGKEYWTYKYYDQDELKEGQIILENSTVSYVYLHKQNTQAEPESFKDYKKNVKEKKKSYEKQFKNLGD